MQNAEKYTCMYVVNNTLLLPEARREAVGGAHEVEPLRLREVLRRQRGAGPAARHVHGGVVVLPANYSSTVGGIRHRRQRVVELPQLAASPTPPRRRPLRRLRLPLRLAAARRHRGLARLDGAVVVPLRPHERPLVRAQPPERRVRPPRALRHRLQRLLLRRRRHGVRAPPVQLAIATTGPS